MNTFDWNAWLGPAADELDDEQRERLESEGAELMQRWPDDPDPDAQADLGTALSALVQYLLGDTTIDGVGEERRRSREAERQASIAAQVVARLAVQDGLPEAEAARRAMLDRMTVRQVLGKR